MTVPVVIHVTKEKHLTHIPGSTVITIFGASSTRLLYGVEVHGIDNGDFFRCMSCMVAASARSLWVYETSWVSRPR